MIEMAQQRNARTQEEPLSPSYKQRFVGPPGVISFNANQQAHEQSMAPCQAICA